MYPLVVIAFIVSAASGRQFQNPVWDGGHGDYRPGVILHDGQYYAVTSTRMGEFDHFPIHVSTDLQNWQEAGYAIPKEYNPEWIYTGFSSPEIHQIGENDFRLIFNALDRDMHQNSIGVGVSQTVLGPYTIQERPLHLNRTDYSYDATLVQDGERKYLVWTGIDGILGRELNPDCLDFAPGSTRKLVLSPDLPWETTVIAAPWYVRRPDGWYMFYSGNRECSESYAVGVARSQHPLGPFEKLAEPILTSNDAFQAPGQPSVVPDIVNGSTVMVYHAFKSQYLICYNGGTGILSQTVEWGEDGWPFMNPN